jgi:C4-type Zn-finger protein
MELTSMQKQTIDKHIHNNSDRECICPICHKDDWQVTDDIIYIRMAGEKLSIAGILCNNCGFIMNRKVQEYIR